MVDRVFRCAVALALLALAVPAGAAEKMVLRMYPVMPAILDVTTTRESARTDRTGGGEFIQMQGSGTELAPRARNNLATRRFFEDLGVDFPPGSYVFYSVAISALWMYNTPENHRKLAACLRSINVIPNQVEIDTSFVAFPLEEIEAVARRSPRATPVAEDIRDLWRAGKGRLLQSTMTLTRSGVNAVLKGVDEIIYPTEYEYAGGATNTIVSGWFIPGSFETREAGTIMNVTPVVGPDGRTIDLTLVPELCENAGWRGSGVERIDPGGKDGRVDIPQPVFHSRNVTTSVMLTDGETVVMGGLPDRTGREITYIFLTARLLDTSGKPVADYEGILAGESELPADAERNPKESGRRQP